MEKIDNIYDRVFMECKILIVFIITANSKNQNYSATVQQMLKV